MKQQLTAIIEREGSRFAALCPELDVASQGGTIEGARKNLQEAVELFLESVTRRRLSGDDTPKFL